MSSFIKQTGRTIQKAFEDYHKNNPSVYEEFKKKVNEAVLKKKDKISSKLIINAIRWEKFLDTTDSAQITIWQDGEFKQVSFRINDAYHSRYSRLYVKEYPERANIFNFRELRSP